jgi:hypothetical protein
MKNSILILALLLISKTIVTAQDKLTPELLWQI